MIKGALESGLFDCWFIEDKSARKNVSRRQLEIPEERIIRSGRMRTLSLLLAVKVPHKIAAKPFIFHSSYYRICHDSNAINVTTIHDFTHEKRRDSNLLKRQVFSIVKRSVIAGSRAVVCVSKATLSDMRSIYPRFADKEARVIYNAPVVDSPAEKPTRPDNYLLYVGLRSKYKHFTYACRLAAMSGMRLKIAGSPLTAKEKLMLLKYMGLKYEMVELPDNSELARLYSRAFCLVYPSQYEGFGIPIVEAQSYGCPVLTMNTSVMPEVAGDGALYLDKWDVRSGRDLLSKLRNRTFREKLTERARKNVKRFSWDRSIKEYIELYRSLGHKSNKRN